MAGAAEIIERLAKENERFRLRIVELEKQLSEARKKLEELKNKSE